jgi:hypothetical protein
MEQQGTKPSRVTQVTVQIKSPWCLVKTPKPRVPRKSYYAPTSLSACHLVVYLSGEPSTGSESPRDPDRRRCAWAWLIERALSRTTIHSMARRPRPNQNYCPPSRRVALSDDRLRRRRRRHRARAPRSHRFAFTSSWLR